MKNIYFYLLFIGFLFNQSFAQKANLVIPMGHAQKINHIEVNYDFSHLASVDDSNIIHIWDTKTKREIYQLKDHDSGIVNIDFHPNKNELLSSDQNGQVFIWNYSRSEVIRKIDTKQKNPFVRYNSDGTKLITGGGNILNIWDNSDGKLLATKELNGVINFIHVSPSTRQIAVGTESGALHVLNEDLVEVYFYNEEKSGISVVRYYDDSNKLMIGYKNGLIILINVGKQTVNRTKKVFDNSVGNILIDPSTSSLVACGNGSQNYVYFLGQTLEDQTPSKFKWSSTPMDSFGLYGLAWADSARQQVYIADHANVIRKWKLNDNEWEDGVFKGTARPIYDIDLDAAKHKLVIGSKQTQIKVYDLTGTNYPLLLEGHEGGIIQLDYHPDNNLVVASDRSGEIKIWNTVQQELKMRIKKAEYLDFNMQFTGEKNILRKVGPDNFELFSFQDKSTQTLNVKDAKTMKISPDGFQIVFEKSQELVVYKSSDLSLDYSIPISNVIDFSFLENSIVTLKSDGKIDFYDKNKKTKELNVHTSFDRIIGLDNGDMVLFASAASKLKSYSIKVVNSNGEFISELEGHNDYVTQVLEVNDNLLSSSLDGSIRIWKKQEGSYKESGTIIPLRKDNFVITTPDQLFDASFEAMSEMHYTRGNDIIALEQLKDSYYEPNLLPKLLGYSSGELRKPLDISKLGIFPELQITHPNLNNGKLGIKITNKGGGIGRVVLVINGKEVASDVREIKNGDVATMGIEYDIQGHPYMYPDKVNKITIKAYNKDGTLGSEPQNILVLPTGDKSTVTKPKIYALIIGSSDYASDDLDLKYAAKDAQDFSAALKISSSNLIGGENLILTTLTTNKEKELWPTKENIKNTFEKYAKEASARDYLIVYMAGHGVNIGGENGDFYYLTCTAKDGRMTSEKDRTADAISSTEFTEYIKKVPALKQVMIVDACHSGTLTSSFGKEDVSKAMDSEEVRALERMKDRTGLFLLAGSAADAVSYETTLYGQGLLTYALLFGMKGAALREGEFIDVLELFQFAAKKVPQLAADIGGIQRPEVRTPGDVGSFDIGKMTEENKAKITLLSPKPVFIQTNFQDVNEFQDALGIGSNLNTKLMALGKSQNAPIVFMDENNFGGAYQVRGRYEQKGGLIVIDVKVFQDNVKTSEFKTQGTNANDVADKILNRLLVDYK